MYVNRDSKAETVVRDMQEALSRRLTDGTSKNCPLDTLKAYVSLCLSQSCGKCTPCRVGLKELISILDKILDGKAQESDKEELENLAKVIYDTADCEIGVDAAKKVLNAIESFSSDFDSHINKNRCSVSAISVPCKELCPAHVDIPGYIALVKDKRYDDAVKLIRYDNPFVSACALVCEHPCERACRRNILDDRINIRAIKRMAVDNSKDHNEVPKEATGKHVAIIGGGPSGLTAAYYLQLMGHKCTVFERRAKLGGMMRYGIPRYRLPDSYLDRDINHILSTGVEVKLDKRIGTEEFEQIKNDFDAIYIAIGAHAANNLGIENEDAENVITAVELLRDMGDDKKPDFAGKDVVIVGGGNVAMDCTRTARRLGAKTVKCVYRRRQVDMTALEEEIEGAIAEECEMVTLKAPVRVEVDEEGKAKALVVQKQISGAYDRGRPKPVKADVEEESIPCDIIIAAIGQKVSSFAFEDAGIEVNRGRFVTDGTLRVKGDDVIYAGGDCQTGPKTVITAVEAGKVVARNIDRELGFDTELIRDVEIPAPSSIKYEQFGRINLNERLACERKDDFDIMEFEMTEQEAEFECSRCLRCDHFGMGALKGGRTQW